MEKVGFEGLIDEDNLPTPQVYQEQNSLDHRVARADIVIRYVLTQDTYDRVIVYGHSEGALVAAKLGTINPSITHLGFWAGNALPDFFYQIAEFMRHASSLWHLSVLARTTSSTMSA